MATHTTSTHRQNACRLSVLQEDFEREPGFYFGAAYVSYALTVALWIALLVALMCFDTWGGWSLACSRIPGLFDLASPCWWSCFQSFTVSRSIWIAMFT